MPLLKLPTELILAIAPSPGPQQSECFLRTCLHCRPHSDRRVRLAPSNRTRKLTITLLTRAYLEPITNHSRRQTPIYQHGIIPCDEVRTYEVAVLDVR